MRLLPLTALTVLGGLLLAGCANTPTAQQVAQASPPASTPLEAAPAGQDLSSKDGTLDVTLRAAENQVPYDGGTRWAMTYNGTVNGPTLRVQPGDTLSVTLQNDLSVPTSLHTHGLHVSPESDNPLVTVDPGASKTFTYAIAKDQPAGTFWYHPHVHGTTAAQVASGLSGALIVEDEIDAALDDATSEDVLMVTDPPLAAENPWGDGSATGMGMGMGDSSGVDMMTQMVGRAGPRLLTNGLDGVDLSAAGDKLARVRIVNGTASTRLQFTWSGGSMTQLSSEGGRLRSPLQVTSVELAPGERTELVLAPGADGGQLTAQRLSNEGSGGAMGEPEVIARASSQADAGTQDATLPAALTSDYVDLFAPGVTVDKKRTITLDGHMNPTIDGKSFDAARVDLESKQGTVEEWVIENRTPMYHPIHLHAWSLQVEGEDGWQDVVQIPPYSKQIIRVRFDDFGGTTVLHCHILDHEDTGMMAVIRVT